MNAKLRILLEAVFLTGLVAMVFLACQMTFERWQDKAAVDSGAAGLMGIKLARSSCWYGRFFFGLATSYLVVNLATNHPTQIVRGKVF